jgi:hypothetical protein
MLHIRVRVDLVVEQISRTQAEQRSTASQKSAKSKELKQVYTTTYLLKYIRTNKRHHIYTHMHNDAFVSFTNSICNLMLVMHLLLCMLQLMHHRFQKH